MFDIGWQEIFVIAVVALIVIGPKDLPRTLRTITGVIRKMKGMARDFQSGLDDIVRESELQDIRKQLEDETGGDIRKQIEEAVDPTGEMAKDLEELTNVENDLNKAASGFQDDMEKTASDSPPAENSIRGPEPVAEAASEPKTQKSEG